MMISCCIVTFIGEAQGVFDLSVQPPGGWDALMEMTQVTLPAYSFNSAEFILTLTPPVGTAHGDYDYTVNAVVNTNTRSFDKPQQAAAAGIVQIGERGVDISITPALRSMQPTDSAVWDVTVTNTGTLDDVFDLSVSGIPALSGSFSQSSLSLAAGASATVQLSADDFSFALPISYTFAVAATSQTDAIIKDDAVAVIDFDPHEDVIVDWIPDLIETERNDTVYYLLVVTNTGSIATNYAVTVGSVVSTTMQTALNPDGTISIPAHASATFLVAVSAESPGTFALDGSAVSVAGSNDDDQAQLIVRRATATTNTHVGTQHAQPTVWVMSAVILLLGLTILRSRKRHDS